MHCEETSRLLHAYTDGELDLVRTLAIEEHLEVCAACSKAHQAQQTLRAALRGASLASKAPADLRGRVQFAVRQAARAEEVPVPRRSMTLRWAGVAAAVALVVLSTWSLVRVARSPSQEELLTAQVLSSHVRSLMAAHLTDVPSTDQHTVKPWFTGKLDFSPPVEDFEGQGFALVGGRLDYLDQRPVAALVYQRRKHLINLFVWPVPGAADAAPKGETRQGYHLFRWTKSGMTYWAVSDINSAELEEFARLAAGNSPPAAR